MRRTLANSKYKCILLAFNFSGRNQKIPYLIELVRERGGSEPEEEQSITLTPELEDGLFRVYSSISHLQTQSCLCMRI